MDVTGRELARYFRCSPRTIGRLVQNRVIGRKRNGKFELEAAISSAMAHYQGRALLSERLLRHWCPGVLKEAMDRREWGGGYD